jgi:hypothetical protein
VDEWKPLHSSTFQLDVSTFYGIRWVVSVTNMAQVEVRRGGVEGPAAANIRHALHVRTIRELDDAVLLLTRVLHYVAQLQGRKL